MSGTTAKVTSRLGTSSWCASCRWRASSRRGTATPASRWRTSSRWRASGLIKAVDRYDPERGNGFTRYAVPTMLGEIKRHFRDKGWSVHVPRATQELVLKVGEALGELPSKLGRSPTPRDIAAAVERAGGGRARGDGGSHAYEAVSLDAPRPARGEEESWTLAESLVRGGARDTSSSR